jgi:hypothetical protein
MPPFNPGNDRTVKIFPLPHPNGVIIALAGEPPVRVAPFMPMRAGLVSTRLPGQGRRSG